MALLILMKTPLLSCLNLKSCKIFLTWGLILLIPLVLITKATLAWGATKKLPLFLATLFSLINLNSSALLASKYFLALFFHSSLLVLMKAFFSVLFWTKRAASLVSLSCFLANDSGTKLYCYLECLPFGAAHLDLRYNTYLIEK